MTYDPIRGHTDLLPHSDSEEANIPNRSRMITSTAITRNVAQQGTVKTQNDKPVFAGVDPNAIAFARWW